MKQDLTLARIKNTNFEVLYSRLFNSNVLSAIEVQQLLSIGVVFLNSGNADVRRFGYRTVLLTCNKINSYVPLYEISIQLGYTPIVQAVANIYKNRDVTFLKEITLSYNEQFHGNGIYRSEQQQEMLKFTNDTNNESSITIAPTSYGKTDLILETIKENRSANICIITPTKALLAQTKVRIMQEHFSWVKKIITTAEMYIGNEPNIVAVLTQERLLRLLKNNKSLCFDYIVIDEAHNLLQDNDRNRLLASSIIILQKRNYQTIFKYFTPFLVDSKSISIKHSLVNAINFKITEYIKSEKYFIYNSSERNEQPYLVTYDQFLDTFFPQSFVIQDSLSFILGKSISKNLLYLNKPKNIESFSALLSINLTVLTSETILKAIENIRELIHPQYNLITCLQRGIIYHHGSVPDTIRLYIEHLYRTIPDIKYVITNSTLLEGVNLPAERMFLLDNKKGNGLLSSSDFKNLVGRVCRFGDVFGKDEVDLKLLNPEIYLVIGNYYSKNANVKSFLQNSIKVIKKDKDKVENILLDEKEIASEKEKMNYEKTIEFIENYESGTLSNSNIRTVKTPFGKSCFENNIEAFDIFTYEMESQHQIKHVLNEGLVIDNVDTLFDTLFDVFFSKIDGSEAYRRFHFIETRNFYKMMLNWRINNASYKQMIASFIGHWNNLVINGGDTLVYVGRWGDTTRNGFREYWTDIKGKSTSEKINLAIVRIKDEQDFLDNKLLRFIEVLNDLHLVNLSFYNRIKYGTDNPVKIALIKNGLSMALANLIVDKYNQHIKINLDEGTYEIKETIITKMKANNENDVLVFEAQYFLT